LSSGRTDARFITSLRGAYQRVFDVELSDQQIQEDLRLAHSAAAALGPYVQHSAADWNDKGKQLLMHAAVDALSPSGTLMEQDKPVLRQLGQALQLPTAEIESLLA
jgi:hypothetical protein